MTSNVGAGNPVQVVWKLTTSGWTFDDKGNKGIEILKDDRKHWQVKPTGPSPTVQYTGDAKKENGATDYLYKIQLLDPNGKPLGWDPTIRN